MISVVRAADGIELKKRASRTCKESKMAAAKKSNFVSIRSVEQASLDLVKALVQQPIARNVNQQGREQTFRGVSLTDTRIATVVYEWNAAAQHYMPPSQAGWNIVLQSGCEQTKTPPRLFLLSQSGGGKICSKRQLRTIYAQVLRELQSGWAFRDSYRLSDPEDVHSRLVKTDCFVKPILARRNDDRFMNALVRASGLQNYIDCHYVDERVGSTVASPGQLKLYLWLRQPSWTQTPIAEIARKSLGLALPAKK